MGIVLKITRSITRTLLHTREIRRITQTTQISPWTMTPGEALQALVRATRFCHSRLLKFKIHYQYRVYKTDLLAAYVLHSSFFSINQYNPLISFNICSSLDMRVASSSACDRRPN